MGNKKPTVTGLLEEIVGEFCDHYCKYPEQYGDTDDGIDRMAVEHCDNCPFNKI